MANDYTGSSVSAAGDMNNDGIADLIVGSASRLDGAASPLNRPNAGAAYVIYGKATNYTFPPTPVTTTLTRSMTTPSTLVTTNATKLVSSTTTLASTSTKVTAPLSNTTQLTSQVLTTSSDSTSSIGSTHGETTATTHSVPETSMQEKTTGNSNVNGSSSARIDGIDGIVLTACLAIGFYAFRKESKAIQPANSVINDEVGDALQVKK